LAIHEVKRIIYDVSDSFLLINT